MIRWVRSVLRNRRAEKLLDNGTLSELPRISGDDVDYRARRGEVVHLVIANTVMGRIHSANGRKRSAELEDRGSLLVTNQALVWKGNLQSKRWTWGRVQNFGPAMNGLMIRPNNGRNIAMKTRCLNSRDCAVIKMAIKEYL